jgi:hypothetical protein
MRFGDARKLAFDLEPLSPSWERRSPSDRGPWARLAIWACDENFCQNWLPSTREVHEGVYIPLAPLADWFVNNIKFIAYEESARAFPTDVDLTRALEAWKSSAPAAHYGEDLWDDLRFDWSGRHFLLAGAEGSWLPNLAFARTDDRLWLSADTVQFATPGAPNFTYRPGVYSVPWRDACAAIAEFVQYVGQHLSSSGLQNIYAWSSEPSPFESALEVDLLDYVNLSLGLSNEEIASAFQIESLEDLRNRLELPSQGSPVDSVALQALRDLEIEEGVVGVALQCDLDTRRTRGGKFLERRLRTLDAAPGYPPEEQGYAAARVVRQDLGLNGEPFRDSESLLQDLFDIEIEERSDLHTLHDHTVAGGHARGFGKVILLDSPQIRKPWSRRMEIFRGVGHLLLDASPEQAAIGAGSSNRSVGPRRRRSGTFAAEMLLPQEAIRKRCGNILDEAAKPEIFEALMSDYGVGAQTAAWQCFNAGLLSSREVVHELIGSYGADQGSIEAA